MLCNCHITVKIMYYTLKQGLLILIHSGAHMQHVFLECLADTPLEDKSNWKARRALMSPSFFFVFSQQLNRDQSQLSTKEQSIQRETATQWRQIFSTVCRGHSFKDKPSELSLNTVN